MVGHAALVAAPVLVTHFARPGTVNVTVCLHVGHSVKTSWLGLTNSISTLCGPGGIPAMSIVLRSLASAHNQGRSSTVMCRCPTLGDTSAKCQ